MTFKDFIVSKIKEISKRFPALAISVEKNEISGNFFTEISPKSEFRENEELIETIHEIYKEQLEKYPQESLTFISNDSYYKISNPFLKVSPKNEYYRIRYENTPRELFDLLTLFNT